MTTLTVNIASADFDENYARLARRLFDAFGPFAADRNPATGDVVLTFPATLTAQQQQAIIDGATAAKTDLLTPAERNAIQSDIDGLVTYQGLSSPTLAQTVQAVKAQSRILRAILRS